MTVFLCYMGATFTTVTLLYINIHLGWHVAMIRAAGERPMRLWCTVVTLIDAAVIYAVLFRFMPIIMMARRS